MTSGYQAKEGGCPANTSSLKCPYKKQRVGEISLGFGWAVTSDERDRACALLIRARIPLWEPRYCYCGHPLPCSSFYRGRPK